MLNNRTSPREERAILARKLFQADYASPLSFKYFINILLISPIKIGVLDRVFWSFCSSLEERTIEKSNEIKFLITNSFIHPWQERLSCFDCKAAMCIASYIFFFFFFFFFFYFFFFFFFFFVMHFYFNKILKRLREIRNYLQYDDY